MKATVSSLICLLGVALLGLVPANIAVGQAINPPVISCAGSLEGSINIQVCAGASGLPAGFSIQWMTCADYIANGNAWYVSDDLRLCKASFSGNANGSRYNLSAGQCVTVTIGDILFDNGASTNCAQKLNCDTCYVFRSFGHATSKKKRSAFTANLTCTTAACPNCCGSLSQGYWRNHVDDLNAIVALNGGTLTIGNVAYTADQLSQIFAKPPAGNGLISLAHQVIAVELSIIAFNGNCLDDDTLTCLTEANALIGNLVVPPIGAGYLAPGDSSAFTACLDAWIQAHDCGEDPTP